MTAVAFSETYSPIYVSKTNAYKEPTIKDRWSALCQRYYFMISTSDSIIEDSVSLYPELFKFRFEAIRNIPASFDIIEVYTKYVNALRSREYANENVAALADCLVHATKTQIRVLKGHTQSAKSINEGIEITYEALNTIADTLPIGTNLKALIQASLSIEFGMIALKGIEDNEVYNIEHSNILLIAEDVAQSANKYYSNAKVLGIATPKPAREPLVYRELTDSEIAEEIELSELGIELWINN